MPLETVKGIWKKHGSVIETVFWIVVFGAAYIAMQKVMHPGWTVFGI